MTRISKIFLSLAVALMLALPSAALAQTPGAEGYRGNDDSVQGIVESNDNGDGSGTEGAQGAGSNPSASQQSTGSGSNPSASQQSSGSGSKGGSLPFTGADLGVLALAGGMLVLMGFGLRRMTHRPSEV